MPTYTTPVEAPGFYTTEINTDSLDYGPIDRASTELCIVEGTSLAPITHDEYIRPMAYFERHVAGRQNNGIVVDAGLDSNRLLAPTVMAHTVMGDDGSNANCGFHSRVVSYTPKASVPTAVPGGNFTQLDLDLSTNLLCAYVGTVRLGAPNGQDNRAGWAANFEAVWTSGNSPRNLVGIEVDIINTGGASTPGLPGNSDNFTAYWAQTAARGTSAANPKPATSAFLITDGGTPGMGWQYGFVGMSNFHQWGFYLDNRLNQPGAGGLKVHTTWSADNAVIAEFSTAVHGLAFYVTGDGTSPVRMRLSGALRQIETVPFSALSGRDVLVAI